MKLAPKFRLVERLRCETFWDDWWLLGTTVSEAKLIPAKKQEILKFFEGFQSYQDNNIHSAVCLGEIRFVHCVTASDSCTIQTPITFQQNIAATWFFIFSKQNENGFQYFRPEIVFALEWLAQIRKFSDIYTILCWFIGSELLNEERGDASFHSNLTKDYSNGRLCGQCAFLRFVVVGITKGRTAFLIGIVL